ncbi:MAG: FIG000875: Thioredoxin domain-containing protein EC-YbbN, partial [uncultured Sphingomonadaceae bacterium]
GDPGAERGGPRGDRALPARRGRAVDDFAGDPRFLGGMVRAVQAAHPRPGEGGGGLRRPRGPARQGQRRRGARDRRAVPRAVDPDRLRGVPGPARRRPDARAHRSAAPARPRPDPEAAADRRRGGAPRSRARTAPRDGRRSAGRRRRRARGVRLRPAPRDGARSSGGAVRPRPRARRRGPRGGSGGAACRAAAQARERSRDRARPRRLGAYPGRAGGHGGGFGAPRARGGGRGGLAGALRSRRGADGGGRSRRGGRAAIRDHPRGARLERRRGAQALAAVFRSGRADGPVGGGAAARTQRIAVRL